MTIQEAISNGKLFKRKKFSWYLKCSRGGAILTENDCEPMLSKADILATDWEIKQ